MNIQKLVGVAVLAAIVGGAAGFYFGSAKGLEEGRGLGRAEVIAEAEKAAAANVNPFGGGSIPVNPFTENVNPLEKVKTNPFE